MKSIRSLAIPGILILFLVFGVQAKSATILVGEPVPDFTLVDQSGQEVSLSDFRGKGVIISFLFTRCPYPDKCPMIGKKLTDLAELSEKIGKDDQLQVLAITLDPAHDKPEVLKAYARGFDESHDNWKFLTGTEEGIASPAVIAQSDLGSAWQLTVEDSAITSPATGVALLRIAVTK